MYIALHTWTYFSIESLAVSDGYLVIIRMVIALMNGSADASFLVLRLLLFMTPRPSNEYH